MAIGELMEELGQALASEGVEAVVELAPGEWVVEGPDGQFAHVEHRDDLGLVTVSTNVGKPDPSERRRVYEAALVYNSLWRHSAGARMSMAGVHQELSLSAELSAARLDLDLLAGTVASILAKGAVWTQRVRGAEASPPPSAGVAG